MNINELAAKLLSRLTNEEVNDAMKASGYLEPGILASRYLNTALDNVGVPVARYTTTYKDIDGVYQTGDVYINWNETNQVFEGEY